MQRPQVLPTWTATYEVHRDKKPYRHGTIHIPAQTQEDAQQVLERMMTELMPNLFPEALITISPLLPCPEATAPLE